MSKEKIIEAYRKFLVANSDAERAIQEKRYLYSDLDHYGVSVWKRREFYQQYQKEISSLSKKEAIELAQHSWSDDYFEVRAFALSVLEINSSKLDISDIPLIEKFMRESKGWAFLDSLIIPLMPSILEKDKEAYQYLKKWIGDDDFWVRRSALLAQLLLFRKGKGDKIPRSFVRGIPSDKLDSRSPTRHKSPDSIARNKKLFFNMAESQFDESWIDEVYKDKHMRSRAKFFIRKAIGWTLREMSVKDPESVAEFLKKNKNKMSGLSFKEGSRKLPEKLKKQLG